MFPTKLNLIIRSRGVPTVSFFTVLLAVTVFASLSNAQMATQWRLVTPAELEMKTPKVEPDADAEAIFWEIRIDDKKSDKLSYDHYVRVKIFTERGRERFAKMDIPYIKGKKVEGVAARVVRPDGSSVELKPTDIFEREIAKVGKAKILAKSFAVPGIEPGVIVEYQYKEIIKGDSAAGERLYFQRDIPMQRVTYFIRPVKNATLGFNYFNMPETRFTEDREGFSVATLTGVPALKEEPYMPPDDEVKKWVFLSYRTFGSFFTWSFMSMNWSRILSTLSKPNKEVKLKAAELTAGATTDEEKLRRIYDFTQKRIRNIDFDTTLTEEQREKVDVKDADDVLKRGIGNSIYINLLFASLAKAAGLDVNLLFSGDRSENFFSPEKYPFQRFIHPAGVAIKIGTTWKYLNPGIPYLPFGRILWTEEGVSAMVIGNGGFVWNKAPVSKFEDSRAKRTGRFVLSEEGTLEGTVKVEYDGHQGIARRRDDYFNSPSKREENFREELKRRIGTAEISSLSIENFDENSKPLTYQYKISIKNYGQKTGKRIFVQPGFFEYGSPAVFSSATRNYGVYFPFPWSESDDIEIKLPKDFLLDNVQAPGDVSDPSKIGSLKVQLYIDKTNNILIYKRAFHFGGDGNILFPVDTYTPIKALFDAFQKSDSHTLSLKRSE